MDIDPVYCEIAVRRIERFRSLGTTGWQNSNPFEKEISTDKILQDMLGIKKYEDLVMQNSFFGQ